MESIPSDADAVRASNLAYYRAFEAGDIEAMAGIWASAAPVSCLHPGWEPVVGREAVLSSWASIFRSTRAVIFTLRGVQLFVVGDAAWVVLIEELDISPVDGQRMRVAMVATNYFMREPDGWEMVHHHSGPGVPASSPATGEVKRMLH
jgi:ketosteroid isomerase-like protein